MKEDQAEIRVCKWCKEEIQHISKGDEMWRWCEGCELIEGETEYITEKEYEEIHG